VETRQHLNALMEPWNIYPNGVGTVEIKPLSPRTREAKESIQHTGINLVRRTIRRRTGARELIEEDEPVMGEMSRWQMEMIEFNLLSSNFSGVDAALVEEIKVMLKFFGVRSSVKQLSRW
jgi:hypothetical protein